MKSKTLFPLWFSDFTKECSEDENESVKNVLSCLTDGTHKRLEDIILPIFKGFPLYGYHDDMTDGKDCYGKKYYIMLRFSGSHISKDFIPKGMEEDFDGKYHQFPKWASIDKREDDDENLYFCIHFETSSPNWNNESDVISAVKLSDIEGGLIDGLDGLYKIDRNVAKTVAAMGQRKIGTDFPDYGDKPTKEQLSELVGLGMKCVYRYGWAYRGAQAQAIGKESALELLASYDYGKGFHQLQYSVKENVPTLEFNELSELDME